MITRTTAQQLHVGQTLYHARVRNRDGSRARCRVNGAVKFWKTRPDDFRIPVKYGLRDCFYITPSNADEWLIEEPSKN